MLDLQLPSLIQSLRPADVEVEWIPVVFGAIFQYPGHSKPTEGVSSFLKFVSLFGFIFILASQERRRFEISLTDYDSM